MKRLPFVIALVLCTVWAVRANAYRTYSENGDATNCRACHGDFQAANYVSRHDGTPWNTSLMAGHYINMVSFACKTCHQASSNFPVSTEDSAGEGGLSPRSCVGCHGREEDAGHDGISEGRGAGLRQHHQNAGVTICALCHADADPSKYTPVGENVLPANYFTPDEAHPDKPTDPCNANGSESKFGPVGLDNDGNGLYDLNDPACLVGVVTPTATVTVTPTPPPGGTPSATPAVCEGDCNGDHQVTVDEILSMVNIALGNANISTCPAGDENHDNQITVDEILTAVNKALNGCTG
jgi:hypothetical protein